MSIQKICHMVWFGFFTCRRAVGHSDVSGEVSRGVVAIEKR